MASEPTPELHVSLCYNTAKEKLKLQVFAARNLPQLPANPEHKFYLRTQVMPKTHLKYSVESW